MQAETHMTQLTQSQYPTDEGHNQTDVDSEVSQINTQPQQDIGQTEYKRPQSRSSSSAVSFPKCCSEKTTLKIIFY